MLTFHFEDVPFITLQTIAGVEARIFRLEGREPFMLAHDLAVAYGTTQRQINRAVKRNPARFPEDFCFRLSEAEMATVRCQFGTETLDRSLAAAFTHAGAYALSGVLKTPVAAEVSVVIHRAFAAMEQAAIEEMRYEIDRLREEPLGARSIRTRIVLAARHDWSFERLRLSCSHSRAQLVQAIGDCLRLKLIDKPLRNMPSESQPPLL